MINGDHSFNCADGPDLHLDSFEQEGAVRTHQFASSSANFTEKASRVRPNHDFLDGHRLRIFILQVFATHDDHQQHPDDGNRFHYRFVVQCILDESRFFHTSNGRSIWNHKQESTADGHNSTATADGTVAHGHPGQSNGPRENVAHSQVNISPRGSHKASRCRAQTITSFEIAPSIVSHIMKQAQTKNTMPASTNMAPALVETYSRLLVYTEIESLGIKGFLGMQSIRPCSFEWFICVVFQVNYCRRYSNRNRGVSCTLCWRCYPIACTTFSPRIAFNCCPICIRWLRCRTQIKRNCIYALRPLRYDWYPALDRLRCNRSYRAISPTLNHPVRSFQPKAKNSIARSFWRLLARCISLDPVNLNSFALCFDLIYRICTWIGAEEPSNAWCKELLTIIMQNTPHSWAVHTLQCFPPVLNSFFAQNSTPKENKQLLKKNVEDEYHNWSQMTNENDIIAHFTAPSTPPLFLCLLFKMVLDTDNIDPVAYKWVTRSSAPNTISICH